MLAPVSWGGGRWSNLSDEPRQSVDEIIVQSRQLWLVLLFACVCSTRTQDLIAWVALQTNNQEPFATLVWTAHHPETSTHTMWQGVNQRLSV